MRPRTLLLLPLLAALAGAQGLAAKLDRALDPTTDPKQRGVLLTEVMAEGGGPAALAQRGLDPRGDSEVVHAVVAALLAGSDPVSNLEPVVRLLTHDAHRPKVASRLQRMAENQLLARRALTLIETWTVVKGDEGKLDPLLRVAAVRALALLPLRESVDLIVEVWGKEKDARVLEECRAALADAVPGGSPDHARAYLRQRPFASYYDLVREVAGARSRDLERLSKYIDIAFRNALARDAFLALGESNPVIVTRAAERILQLAEQIESSADAAALLGMTPEEFARGTFDAFVREQRNGAVQRVIALLADSLARLSRGNAKAPLRPAVVPVGELVDAIGRLAASPADWEEAGRACIRLLEEVGEPGVRVLARFAGDSGSADVRIRAITAMRSCARKPDAGPVRDFIGRQLAERLEREKEPTVRSRILFAMCDAPVTQAIEPIRRLLREEGGTPLSDADAGWCIEILRSIRTPEALATLFDFTAPGGTAPRLWLLAASEGLVKRLAGTAEDAAILDRLRSILRSAEVRLDERTSLLERIGESGVRGIHALLGEIARDEALDAPLRKSASNARLRLAERLTATAAEAPGPSGDFEVVGQILLDEWRGGGEAARIEALARAAVQAGESGKAAVGPARFLVARLADRDGADIDAVRKLYRAALERVLDDRVAPPIEREMLLRFRAILRQGPISGETAERFANASKRLAALTEGDLEAALGYWVDAVECTIDAGDRAKAQKLADEMPREGGLPPAIATRLEQALSRREPVPPGNG